jgi:NADH-quinone oxidoreductase subunit J
VGNFATLAQWLIGFVLILSSLGVILARKPVHASLCFLVTLLALAALYLQLSAQFIAVMQILVYAGAILVIFMFVIVLFQDAYQQLSKSEAKSTPLLLIAAAAAFLIMLVFLGKEFIGLSPAKEPLAADFGSVQALGKALYIDFFFPFEAVILIFLVALVGALYIGRRAA